LDFGACYVCNFDRLFKDVINILINMFEKLIVTTIFSSIFILGIITGILFLLFGIGKYKSNNLSKISTKIVSVGLIFGVISFPYLVFTLFSGKEELLKDLVKGVFIYNENLMMTVLPIIYIVYFFSILISFILLVISIFKKDSLKY
jgi:hypothetical protein